MSLLCLQWRPSGQRGETSPLHPQLPPSSDKQGEKKQDAHNAGTTSPLKISRFWCCCSIIISFPYLSFVADISNCNTGQLEKPRHIIWVKETNSLYEVWSFQPSGLVTLLTMPTQILVIQGLESSFLYTRSFPLVSPTTSSFNYSEGRQTACSLGHNTEGIVISRPLLLNHCAKITWKVLLILVVIYKLRWTHLVHLIYLLVAILMINCEREAMQISLLYQACGQEAKTISRRRGRHAELTEHSCDVSTLCLVRVDYKYISADTLV